MNREEILSALKICTRGDSFSCDDCPLKVEPGCMYKLIMEARILILSLLEEKKVGAIKNQEPEPLTRQRVLREAEKCVCGQREQDYGTPEDSFRLIAQLWESYIRDRVVGNADVCVNPEDIAIMMALLKIARLSANPEHMDSWVDLAGYAACGGEIAGRE